MLALLLLALPFPQDAVTSRDEGLRSDIEYFVDMAQREHADPERAAFSTAFLEQAGELHEALPRLTDDQVLAGLMRLAAVLDDGHTAIYGAGPDTPLELDRRVLPFKLYWFPEGLTIVDGSGKWAQHAGSRIVRFGGMTTEEVLRRMSEYRGGDNSMTWKWMGPQFYVRSFSLLTEVGAAAPGEPAELTLLTRNGEERVVSVPGGDHELVRKLRPSPAAEGDVPRYLRDIDTNFWLEPMPEHGALYFQFNQVRDDRRESIAGFAERLRESLASEGATTLIVDVRHNNGGNNTLVRPLIRTMAEFEMRSPEHRIFVLMGRNTFSAAQNFINRTERWTNAVFVGEPSSSSPNFVGEENELVLPYSRLHGSLSNLFWQDSDPFDGREWIAPDIPVELTAADYFAGVDPALNAVLEVLAGD